MTRNTTDGAETETTETSLTIGRTFEAPRSRVYRAFVEPDDIEVWQAVGEMVVEVHAIEAEPGGTLSMTHALPEGRFRFDGEFLDVVENERLVHTLQVVEGPFTDDEVSRVTVEFRDAGDGCEVTFTEERVDPAMLEDTATTWNRMLERLAEVVP